MQNYWVNTWPVVIQLCAAPYTPGYPGHTSNQNSFPMTFWPSIVHNETSCRAWTTFFYYSLVCSFLSFVLISLAHVFLLIRTFEARSSSPFSDNTRHFLLVFHFSSALVLTADSVTARCTLLFSHGPAWVTVRLLKGNYIKVHVNVNLFEVLRSCLFWRWSLSR